SGLQAGPPLTMAPSWPNASAPSVVSAATPIAAPPAPPVLDATSPAAPLGPPLVGGGIRLWPAGAGPTQVAADSGLPPEPALLLQYPGFRNPTGPTVTSTPLYPTAPPVVLPRPVGGDMGGALRVVGAGPTAAAGAAQPDGCHRTMAGFVDG